MATIWGLRDKILPESDVILQQQSPVLLTWHIHKVIFVLSPVISTPVIYITLAKFEELFIYL